MRIDLLEAIKNVDSGKVRVSFDDGARWFKFCISPAGYMSMETCYGLKGIENPGGATYDLSAEPDGPTIYGLKLVTKDHCSAFYTRRPVHYGTGWQEVPGNGVYVADDYSSGAFKGVCLAGNDNDELALVLVECAQRIDLVCDGVSRYRWCRIVASQMDTWDKEFVLSKLNDGLKGWIKDYGKRGLTPTHYSMLSEPTPEIPAEGDVFTWRKRRGYLVISKADGQRLFPDTAQYPNALYIIDLSDGLAQYFSDPTPYLKEFKIVGNGSKLAGL